ncbi:uncharacterized protein LOC135374217 [Ornithodoros turicata]|uniref:uncharacterized protein LOC135374217 n=1 Tax=Ornithodoros turicata TaxID=34597 RepID=UPI0031397965
MVDAARTARENLDGARLDQARQYNRGRRNLTYSVGDLVLRRTPFLSQFQCHVPLYIHTARFRRPSTGFWTPGLHSPLLSSTPLRGHLDGRGQWPACGMDVTVPLEQPAPATAGRRPVTDSCPVQGSHTNRQAPLGPPPTSDRRGEADPLSAMSSARRAQGDPPQRHPAPSPPRSNPHSVRRCHRYRYITSPSSGTAGGVRTCQAAHNTTCSSGTR